ncbi:efflux transporter outer membrane subunit [Massilia terrae]|uniref:Efflux transporter outer membrane subunit n=1 Tax=Massilia terrae TaxID=1811224 RepID=A0ABT2CRA1_9BURK|nr:efflux transporter outer membrane subunit [Massilia terrae]MCS0656499.1 efflux transporter outer membrane subunit [Massilia terrae]
MRRLLAIAPALVLAACSLPRHPPPAPTLQVPAQWRTDIGPGSPVERDWWRAFHDPALADLVRQALARNGDIRTAQARLQEYRARITVARSVESPQLNASFSPGRARVIGPFGTPIDVTSITGGVQASYEIDVSGRSAAAIEAARLDYASQQAAADATALSVAANTASGYLTLRGLDAQLELARATLVTRQRSLDLARREFEVGYSSRLELAQAESEFRATSAVVPQLERSITLQEDALAVLTGASPGPVARGLPLGELAPPMIATLLPSELLRRRPDVAAAERAVAAADAALAAARDQLLPSFNLAASITPYANSVSQLLNSPFTLWSVGGSVLAPIFNGGRLRAQTDIAASARDRAVIAYESAVRSAFADTENALASIRFLGRQLAEGEARRVAAAEALRIARNRHANGYASYLEELDAQRALYSVENAQLQLRAGLLGAHVDLYRALGGGWLPPAK